MYLEIKESSPAFSFTANARELLDRIQKVMTVTGFTSSSGLGKHHLIVSYNKEVFILGYSDETYAVVKLEGVTSTKSGSFNFDPERLTKLIKGRGEIEFEYDGSRLGYSAGRFSGDLVTVAVSIDQIPRVKGIFSTKNSNKGGAIKSDLLEAVKEGVKMVDLKDNYFGNTLNCNIDFDGEKLSVSSFDNFHLAKYDREISDKKAKPFKLAMPANMFSLIDRFTEDSPAKFFMEAQDFRVLGKDFLVGLPPVQLDKESFEIADKFVSTLGKPLVQFTTDSSLTAALDNLLALEKDGAKLSMKVSSKGQVQLGLKTDHGEAKDAFKVSDFKSKSKLSKLDLKLDPPILLDLLRNIKSRNGTSMRVFGNSSGVPSSFVLKPDFEGFNLVLLGYLA